MKRFQITEAEYEAIKAKESETKDKNVSRRLRALILWHEGKSLKTGAARIELAQIRAAIVSRRISEALFAACPYTQLAEARSIDNSTDIAG